METAQSPLTFTDRLIEGIRAKRSILNVGLDPQVQFIPPHFCEVAQALAKHNPFEAVARAFLMFNERIIDAVEPFAVSVKPHRLLRGIRHVGNMGL